MDTATVTASIEPSPPVKGATRGHTVRCNFSLTTGEKFYTMNLYLTDQRIAFIYNNGGPPVWVQNAPQDLQQRGTLNGSESQELLTLAISDTLCSDQNQSYKCDLQWIANSVGKSSYQTATVALEGAVC